MQVISSVLVLLLASTINLLVPNQNSARIDGKPYQTNHGWHIISPGLAHDGFLPDLSYTRLYFALNYNNRTAPLSRSKCSYLLLLLVLAGDTGFQLNPGPCKYPCGVCQKPVKSNQAGIECEECLLWYHKKCIYQSTHSYKARNSRGSAVAVHSRIFLLHSSYNCQPIQVSMNFLSWMNL